MGIIGLGRIGGATAVRAKGLGIRVLAYDPYVRPRTDKVLGVSFGGMGKASSKTCDIISIHTPFLTEETRCMIDAKALSLMKPSAIFVNTARGAVVDTDALAMALREGRIAGVGVDVLPQEPAQASMPLVALWQEERQPPCQPVNDSTYRLLFGRGLVEMRRKAAEELKRVLTSPKPEELCEYSLPSFRLLRAGGGDERGWGGLRLSDRLVPELLG